MYLPVFNRFLFLFIVFFILLILFIRFIFYIFLFVFGLACFVVFSSPVR